MKIGRQIQKNIKLDLEKSCFAIPFLLFSLASPLYFWYLVNGITTHQVAQFRNHPVLSELSFSAAVSLHNSFLICFSHHPYDYRYIGQIKYIGPTQEA